METVLNAQLVGFCFMNPCPVHEELTGNHILFFIETNLAHLCHVTHTDNGCPWSPAQGLTDTVIGTAHKDRAAFSHLCHSCSVRLSLVIPASVYQILDPGKKTSLHAFCFVSSDHEKTWAMRMCVAKECAVECQVAEMHSRGQNMLDCNARNSQGARTLAVSYSHGMDFYGGQQIEKLIEPPHGCHGSVIGFTSQVPLP